MYAIRGTRPGPGFRVGATVFHFAAWVLLAEITEEHRHAAKHGALVMLESVEGPEDVRLAPHPVTVDGEDKPTVRRQEDLVAEFRALLAARDQEIANLHTQVMAVEAENHRAYDEIADLKLRLAGMETQIGEVGECSQGSGAGVGAKAASFPAETAGATAVSGDPSQRRGGRRSAS